MSGLFAVNKPSGISSAGLLNDLQHVLKVSSLFEQEIKAQQAKSNAGRKGRKQKMGNKIKMGHGGTLDPLASGVLVVGTGRGTKDLGKFLHCSKDYEAIALFGCSTDTYDSEGKVVHRRPWKHITEEKLESILSQFRGDIMQTPPIYSALKMQGKPLYEYAREGKPLPAEIKARPATVSRFEITKFTTNHEWKNPSEEASTEIVLSAEALEQLRPASEARPTGAEGPSLTAGADLAQPGVLKDDIPSPKNNENDVGQDSIEPPAKRQRRESPVSTVQTHTEDTQADSGSLAVHISMTVSSGTYVRSLIHDLGLAMGSAAHMVALVRKRVGEFNLEDAIPWSAFEQDTWQETLKTRLDFSNEPIHEQVYDGTEAELELNSLTPAEVQVAAFLQPCMPFTRTLTYAQSLDAKISGPNSSPLTISCPESFRVTHELRRRHDLILVGVGTAVSDDPGLNARDSAGKAYPLEGQPIPVILDPSGRFELTNDSKMIKNVRSKTGKPPLQLVHESRRGHCKTLARVIYVKDKIETAENVFRFAWSDIFNALEPYGKSIMIEGGSNIIQEVLQRGIADHIIITIAPTFVGPGSGLALHSPVNLAKVRSEIFGRDTVLVAQRRSIPTSAANRGTSQ
ncbi:Pseudouridine synthase [Taphrina deformans PYCC 5710]|uniref:2,5-diamino-6-ribosylamino-4(3H)-pyrimidinone 5'-phosphate reductase n=1 Tax=Taphrina deformans (strain PYCC 5710 / ATCC 11124 / CBS 356.35 / IMI 108563 / JCM 9778 / NBRC 8474) TaxID=1097556 RepID=R4X9Y2_TAPDE|nr:Pseudouridine synthase [Taphrina deformans PYCC 5710]|eukprot:CCG81049.1 Pseudouridine synthase [Taphrina deformans PYCC 5710]